jgi:hypothetical protein
LLGALGQVHARHIPTIDSDLFQTATRQLVAALEHGRQGSGIASLGEDIVTQDQR